MALTKKDLQAIEGLLVPIYNRLDGMDKRFDRMDKRFDRMDERMDRMDRRMDKMDNRLDKLDSEVSSLKSGQLDIRKELKEINRKVSDTYDLALESWGIGTENRKWLEEGNSFSTRGLRDRGVLENRS